MQCFEAKFIGITSICTNHKKIQAGSVFASSSVSSIMAYQYITLHSLPFSLSLHSLSCSMFEPGISKCS